MSRRLSLASAFVLLASWVVLAAPHASAQQASITLEVGEGNDCSGDKTFCFEVASGSLDDLTGGANVSLRFVNDGQSVHNVYVAPPGDADDDHQDTPAGAAYANTETIGPGSETSLNFTVPENDQGVYLWCDVQGHENLGMWMTNANGNGNGNGQQDSPLSAWVVILALAGAVLISLRVPGRR